MMKNFPSRVMPMELVRAFVDALHDAGRNDEANEVLAGHFMPRKEGVEPLQPTNQAK
jgi:hypothetical protein